MYQEILQGLEAGKVGTLLTFDISKAFSSLSHTHVVKAAARLGVRLPLVRLIASYLSERETVIKWDGEQSDPRLICGGSGQGTLMSVILFLISVDALICKLERDIEQKEKGLVIQSTVKLFCDDLSILTWFDKEAKINGQRNFCDDGRIGRYLQTIQDFSSDNWHAP